MSDDVTNDRAASNIFAAFFKGLRNYFNFRGRTCRYDYWAFSFLVCLVSVSFSIASYYVPDFIFIQMVFELLLFFPTLAIFVRRLHDVNKSFFKWCILPIVVILLFQYALKYAAEFIGFYYAMGVILVMQIGLLVLFFVVFIFTCQKGKPEDNKYGNLVIEDESHDRKSVWMILFFILSWLFFMCFAIIWGMIVNDRVGQLESTIKQFQSNVNKRNLEYQRILSERNDVEEDEVQEENFEARETEASE